MQALSQKLAERIGYIVSSHSDELGYVGGLLVVNQNARPLEFHCTIPIQPKPAQTVLYGATLNSYLLEEQIPAALLGKAKSKIDLLLGNQLGLLGFRDHTSIPLGILSGDQLSDNTETDNESSGLVIGETEFSRIENVMFAHRQQNHQDRPVIENAIKHLVRSVEIDEPFERLSIAIQETCKSLSNAA